MTGPVAVDESFAARWCRRAVTIPLYLTLGALSAALLPLWVLVGLAIDAARRDRRLVTVRCVLGLALYFVCEAAGLIASAAVWAASGVWMGIGRERFVSWNLALQRLWARTLYGGATHLFDMRTEVTGAATATAGPLVMFSRHASTLDTLLPMVFVSCRGGVRLRYVMKRELLWDPCLDVVGQRTHNAFVRRGSSDSEKQVAIVRQLAKELGDRDGVLLFPEGTRFSPAKRTRALERLAAGNQPERLERARSWRHVLPPRLGGALAVLQARPDADAVFLAHTGFEGTARLSDIWGGKLLGRTVRLCFWRIPSTSIPRDPQACVEWLDEQWTRIDASIGTGT